MTELPPILYSVTRHDLWTRCSHDKFIRHSCFRLDQTRAFLGLVAIERAKAWTVPG